jgi:hypothetical protein
VLIESLARIGHVVRAARADAAEVVADVTDATSADGAKFLYNVVPVEIDPGTGRVAVHPPQHWTQPQQDDRGRPAGYSPAELPLAAAAPLTVSRAGNPKQPQRSYPVPAYLCYGRSGSGSWRHAAQLEEMAADPAVAERFLEGRLPQTQRGKPPAALVPAIAAALHQALRQRRPPDEEAALLLLLAPEADGPYGRVPTPFPGLGAAVAPGVLALAASQLVPSETLVARLDVIQEAVFAAKAFEAEDMCGAVADGRCMVCGRLGRALSIYTKNWPWYAPTWEAPLPQELPVQRLAEGVAVCPSCYGDLLAGANAFKGSQQQLLHWLSAELFAGDAATAWAGRSVERISAGMMVLPVADLAMDDAGQAREYAQGLERLRRPGGGMEGAVRHLEAVVGAALVLPRELERDVFRLTLVYLTVQNAEVQLRAVIEDVVPPTLAQLENCLAEAQRAQREVINAWAPAHQEQLGSLPYLLLRAYGPGFFWSSLQTSLHRQPLGRAAVLRRLSQRLGQLARLGDRPAGAPVPSPRRLMRQEIAFLLVFRSFWNAYHRTMVRTGGQWAMRPWRELQQALGGTEPPAEGLGDVEELGFAVGHLTRRFASMYWRKTGERGGGRDFLRHRVLVFGSALTPQQLIRQGLGRIPEYALQQGIGLPAELRVQLGFVLQEYLRQQGAVQQDPEAFLVAFWSGYYLYELYDRASAVETEPETSDV